MKHAAIDFSQAGGVEPRRLERYGRVIAAIGDLIQDLRSLPKAA